MIEGLEPTKGVAILFEKVEKGLSDPLGGPFWTACVRSHPVNGERGGWCGVDEARMVEGSGNSASEEDMSQSQVPPQNPRNPHRATR